MTTTTPPRLYGSPWLKSPETRTVFQILSAAGHHVRAVGGTVRNALLGEPVTDIDLATTAPPEDTLAVAQAAGLRAIPTGQAHGTITVVVNGTPFEITTLREDVETDGRHAEVRFTDDWARDASRRDFTINALYCDADGTVYDPLGGYADLCSRRVRFIGDSDQRIAEDRLRILRFFRFSARYAGDATPLDHDGLQACVRGRSGLGQLSAERVRTELVKLLVGPRPAETLHSMRAWGVLAPCVPNVPAIGRFARLTALEANHALSPDPMRRLAALFAHHIDNAAQLATHLRLSNEERDALSASSGRPMPEAFRDAFSSGDRADTDFAVHILSYRFGVEGAMARLLRAATDRALPDAVLTQALATLQTWDAPDFPVSGRDLIELGAKPGPHLGAQLATLETEWIATDFCADREALLERAAELVAQP